MKLSDLDSDEIQLVAQPQASASLKLSDLHPDDVQAGAAQPEANPNTSAVTAATTGFFSGIPGVKQLAAGAKTGMDVLTGITPLSDAGDDYRNTRDSLSNDFNAASNAHPVVAGAANLVGAATLNPALELAAGSKALAPVAAKLGSIGTQGALYGAADAASQAEADNGSASDIVANTLKGGILGGAVGKGVGALGEKIAPYFKKAGTAAGEVADTALDAAGDQVQDAADTGTSKLMTWARQNALKSLNPTAGDIESLGVEGQGKMGKFLLENQLAGKASMEAKLSKVNQVLDDTGSKIGTFVDQLDGEGAQAFSPSELSDHVSNTYADNYRDSPAYNWALEQIKKVTPEDGGNLTFGEAFDLKKKINAKAYSMKGDPSQVGNIQFLRSIGNDITSAYKQAAGEFLTPEENQLFLKANSDYGLGLSAKDILEGSQAKEFQGSSGFGPIAKTIAAGGALLTGHPFVAAGLVSGAAKDVASSPGLKAPIQQSLANAGDAISNALQKTPSYFGKYSQSLQAAQARGPTSFAATHFLLQQQDSVYREKVRKLQEQGNE